MAYPRSSSLLIYFISRMLGSPDVVTVLLNAKPEAEELVGMSDEEASSSNGGAVDRVRRSSNWAQRLLRAGAN